MKVIKLAIFSFIFLFTIVFLISLLFPSNVRVSRAVDIKAPKDSVLTMIGDVSNWKSWYPRMDSSKPLYADGHLVGMTLDDTDPAGPTYIRLESKTADEVTAVFTGNKIKPVLNTWKLIDHPHTDSITVQWYMDFNLRWYPWEKFASLVLEKSNGRRMEEGLNNLKKHLAEHLSSNN